MISPRSELLPAFESRVAHESISEIAVSGVVALARLFLSPHCAQADIVFVSNYTNNTIEVFNSSGQQSAVVSNGLSGPTGLAFNGGNLYVANDGDNTIEKFNSTGQGTVFASTGVSGPTGLAFDTNGNLFVANTLGNTIEKFNSSGVGTVFANLASGLDDPVGLAFDTKGNLYVSNVGVDPPFANAITKFTPGGVVTNFASGLNQPAGLAFDSSGNLYVANSGAATIVKYTSNGSGSTFASSGLYAPLFIAIQVPEPATWILVAFGIGAFLGGCHLRRRSP